MSKKETQNRQVSRQIIESYLREQERFKPNPYPIISTSGKKIFLMGQECALQQRIPTEEELNNAYFKNGYEAGLRKLNVIKEQEIKAKIDEIVKQGLPLTTLGEEIAKNPYYDGYYQSQCIKNRNKKR